MTRTNLQVLFVASEVDPFSKTGGLGDVVGALPRALARLGVGVRVVAPFYRATRQSALPLARRLQSLTVALGDKRLQVGLYEGRLPGTAPGTAVDVALLDYPPYFDRPGLYGEGATDFPDNALRFALLARGALELARTLGPWPDVVHAHDWQAALAPLLFARAAGDGRPRPGAVFTVHNLGFQGLFPRETLSAVGLGWDLFSPDGLEFYGQLSFMKAGIVYADRVTTVSPRYAREIRTPEFGHGLDGLLRAHEGKLRGILNGADYEAWSPARDRLLAARYDDEDLAGKAACKAALQRELGLPVRAEAPLAVMVSRLTEQKGSDLLVAAAPELLTTDLQLAVLGTGEPALEAKARDIERRYPQRAAVRIAYDDALAHRMLAGGDLLLMPSRYEPCGLTQLYALRYGTIPVARSTGGLDDTIVDYDPKTHTGSGFKFDAATSASLIGATRRALRSFAERDHWQELVRRAMRLDYSWEASARSYLEVYEQARKDAAARRRDG